MSPICYIVETKFVEGFLVNILCWSRYSFNVLIAGACDASGGSFLVGIKPWIKSLIHYLCCWNWCRPTFYYGITGLSLFLWLPLPRKMPFSFLLCLLSCAIDRLFHEKNNNWSHALLPSWSTGTVLNCRKKQDKLISRVLSRQSSFSLIFKNIGTDSEISSFNVIIIVILLLVGGQRLYTC